jgi:UDPglucose 6-dehydrogenase
MNSVSVFGNGKLGLPLAACLASKGYQVIGVDPDQRVIKTVNEGKSPFYEPGLAELIKSVSGHLSATDDYRYAVQNSEVSFIIVPTPSEPDGSFSTKYVKAAAEQIATTLKNMNLFHLVVLTSTVLPGDTEGVVKQVLENLSGKKCGEDFGLCYSPEFIALGSVIRDLTNPDVILIGESDPRSGELLAEIYGKICENQPPVVRTSIRNAELAKISLNAYVTMKITFANSLAEMAESMPGGNADAISQMLGFDSRIGRKYLSGGLPYGGPCFPRDNKALAFFARQAGCEPQLFLTTHEINEKHIDRIVTLIEQKLSSIKGKKISILGLTYKPNTDIVEESAGGRIAVYDPAGMENAQRVLGEQNIYYANSTADCLQDSELCLLTTPWESFKALTPDDFRSKMKRPCLLDCWRFFNQSEFKDRLEYFAVGLSSTG